MATRGPFVVRLYTPDQSMAVNARDVQFSQSWRGGFQDAQITLLEPLNSRSPLLSPFARLRIDDARTSRTTWEGYLDLPGKRRSDEGDVWQIGAVGPSARLSDRQKPYIVVDRDLSGWDRSTENVNALVSARAEVTTHPTDDSLEAIVLQFQPGAPIGPGTLALMAYNQIDQLTSQLLGGFGFTAVCGNTLAGTSFQSRTGEPFETEHDETITTTPTTRTANWNIQWSGSDKTILTFRMFRTGAATNVTVDTHWTAFYDVHVVAKLYDQQGVGIDNTTGIYSNGLVKAHQIVTDALWWLCADESGNPTSIDIAGASIDTTFTHDIDHFAHKEPVTMQGVLEGCALLEPDMAWGVFEANADLRHRFKVWRIHDGDTVAGSAESGARYRATAIDGWDAPGGEADLRNAVTVAWEDSKGRQKSKTYTTTGVQELDQWSIIRDADVINLGPELGSLANADRIGPKFLEQASMPPESGTLTVARPILDMWKGMMVQPWEIEPGYPILISDVDIPPQTITEVAYRDSDASASVTVGEPILSSDQIVNLYAKTRQGRG